LFVETDASKVKKITHDAASPRKKKKLRSPLSLSLPLPHNQTLTSNKRKPLLLLLPHLPQPQKPNTRKQRTKMTTHNRPAEGPSSNTKMRPPADANVVEKVASPLATLSSHVDPWPHYIMSAACESFSFLFCFVLVFRAIFSLFFPSSLTRRRCRRRRLSPSLPFSFIRI
jgi:hypothetical protein